MKQISIAFILLLVTLSAHAQKDASCIPLRNFKEDELSFGNGEKLTIVANYQWGAIDLDMGEINLVLTKETLKGQTYLYARASVKTYAAGDKIFPIRDTYEGKFSLTNLRPSYFHRNISEGGYTTKNTYTFNSDYSINATIGDDGNSRNLVIPGKQCTFDVMSLFYNTRNLDFSKLTVGKTLPLSFAIDDKAYNLRYRYIGREIIDIEGLGKFSCLKFAAQLVAGNVFKGKEQVYIWITDDKNHLPVYIESPVAVGKATARISKYSNLKWPLTSKK